MQQKDGGNTKKNALRTIKLKKNKIRKTTTTKAGKAYSISDRTVHNKKLLLKL